MTTVTLDNLTEAVHENRLKNLAINIAKYRKFKTNAIIRKIDNAGYSLVTLAFYINKGIRYLEDGSESRYLGSLVKYLDECIRQHIQPLEPKIEDRRIVRQSNKQTKQAKPNITTPTSSVQRVLDSITSTCNSNLYAVQMNRNLRLFDSNEEAQAFLEGLSFMGRTDAMVVEVEIKK